MRRLASREKFLFLANHLALDFLNTRPVRKGHTEELLTGFPLLLRWFVRASLIDTAAAREMGARWSHRPEGAAGFLHILSLRERLRSAIFAIESTRRVPRRAIEDVNRLLRLHPVTFQVVKADGHLAKEVRTPVAKPDDLLGILANLLADLLTEVSPRRIRKCEACVLHFRDTTKNRTRRWCSMRACGNRAKVAAYAARKKGRG